MLNPAVQGLRRAKTLPNGRLQPEPVTKAVQRSCCDLRHRRAQERRDATFLVYRTPIHREAARRGALAMVDGTCTKKNAATVGRNAPRQDNAGREKRSLQRRDLRAAPNFAPRRTRGSTSLRSDRACPLIPNYPRPGTMAPVSTREIQSSLKQLLTREKQFAVWCSAL